MKNKKSNKGFSFVELIIVIALLSIIMIAICQFMTSSVNTYNRTNSDNKVQQLSQETYDKLSNHIMQAVTIKLLVNDNEYGANFDEQGSVTEPLYVDPADYKIKYIDTSSNAEKNLLSISGKTMYSFDYFGSESTAKWENVQGIYIVYPSSTTYMIAEYYYDSTNKKLYLKTQDTGISIIEGVPTSLSPTTSTGTFTLGKFENPTDSEYLLCSGVESFEVTADSGETAIGIDITINKRKMSYESSGMVKVRNGNTFHVTYID